MNDIPWDTILTRIGAIVISVALLWSTLQALSWGYMTAQEFLWIVMAIMAAWGLGVVGTGTYGIGKKSGFSEGYTAGLQFSMKKDEH